MNIKKNKKKRLTLSLTVFVFYVAHTDNSQFCAIILLARFNFGYFSKASFDERGIMAFHVYRPLLCER